LIADGSAIIVHAGSVSDLGGSFRLNSLVRASRCIAAAHANYLGRVEPIQAASDAAVTIACACSNLSRRQMCVSLYKNLETFWSSSGSP